MAQSQQSQTTESVQVNGEAVNAHTESQMSPENNDKKQKLKKVLFITGVVIAAFVFLAYMMKKLDQK